MTEEDFKNRLNRQIFWDVDFDKVDVSLKKKFVIERVFDRGDVEDIRACRRFYTEKEIKLTLLASKSLRLHRLYLASAIIDQPLTKFRCYKNRQLTQELSVY